MRAEADNIQVHGILYVLDELVRHEIIPCVYAAEKLEVLWAVNKRLPKEEIDTRLHAWTSLTPKNLEMEGKAK